MTKRVAIFFIVITLFCCACGKEETPIQPQETQVRAICELATLECYYHNVAKYKEEDAEGFWLWKKDKHFWMEYSGIVKLGIEASLVMIEVNDNVVRITMPPAKVMKCTVDEESLDAGSIIVANKSADVKAEDLTEAFAYAQAKMELTAMNDAALLAQAQQRAQKLLEDYVNNIGKVTDTQYTIEWVYVDESGKPMREME
jgi:hypothetical protein